MARAGVAVRAMVLAMGAGSLGACAPYPLKRESIEADPRLAEIHAAFDRSVREARGHPDEDWWSGWEGNWIVNTFGGDRRGLCYHWQEVVHRGVWTTVERVGWDAVGITINRDHGGEHHAVLVFDPVVTTREGVLGQPKPRHGFVLDAWRRGVPEVYTLDDWVTMPRRRRRPEELEILGPDGKVIEPESSEEGARPDGHGRGGADAAQDAHGAGAGVEPSGSGAGAGVGTLDREP